MQFYRECQPVANTFIQCVRDWPWEPGGEQEAFATLDERAQLGLGGAATFRSWMAGAS